jgi:hypothetical protein
MLETSAILNRPHTPKVQFLLRLLKVTGPAVLSIFVAWGAVQFAKGRDSQRLDTLDKQMEETRNALDNTLTREEFRNWTTEQRERFRELREDLRDMRDERKSR